MCSLQGSPPRMRGKGYRSEWTEAMFRITPAYAGKRKTKALRTWAAGDHPRVCGEKLGPSVCAELNLGSPPHMRGKGLGAALGVPARGITPAYAGKSHIQISLLMQTGDHPRICGEKWFLAVLVGNSEGSPPRMRGKDTREHRSQLFQGITPAYAGKSPG